MSDKPEKNASSAPSETKPSKDEILEQVTKRLAEVDAKDKGPQRVVRPLGKEGLTASTTADVEDKDNKPTPVKVATSNAKVETEGSMEPGEVKKLQAMLGAAKSKDGKTFAGLKGVERVIDSGSIDPRATLIFANCEDCTFTIDSLCTKVFVQSCKNVNFVCRKKIVTNMLEMYKCEDVSAHIHVKIGTMQLDMSRNLQIKFEKKQHFGAAIWAGCHKLHMSFVDSGDEMLTGFGDMQEEYADLNEERSQFKLHCLEGKLVNEKVIRLDNGFPTTKREKDAFDARQERNMKILADKMGIVVPPKPRDEPKVSRNEPCVCGSGRKYKKCCGLGK